MGGGGSKASSKSTIVNDFVSKSMAESIMNCTNRSSINQSLTLRGNFNVVKGVNMKQGFSLSSTCYQDATSMTKLSSDLSNAVKQSAEAQNIALLGALSNSEANVDSYLRSSIRNEVSSSTVQNIVNETNANQGIDIAGNHNIVADITMNQVVDMIADATQRSMSSADVTNMMKNLLEGSTAARQDNPLDVIADMIASVAGSIMGPFYLIAAIIGLVIIILLYLMVGRGGGGDGGGSGNGNYGQMQYYGPPGYNPGYNQGNNPGNGQNYETPGNGQPEQDDGNDGNYDQPEQDEEE